jgi:hypothetical protein
MAKLIDLVKLGSSISKEYNGNSNSGNTKPADILSTDHRLVKVIDFLKGI